MARWWWWPPTSHRCGKQSKAAVGSLGHGTAHANPHGGSPVPRRLDHQAEGTVEEVDTKTRDGQPGAWPGGQPQNGGDDHGVQGGNGATAAGLQSRARRWRSSSSNAARANGDHRRPGKPRRAGHGQIRTPATTDPGSMLAKIIDWSGRNRSWCCWRPVRHRGWVYAVIKTPLTRCRMSDVQVIVSHRIPGQAPQVVEDQVTYPLTTSMLSV